MLVNPARIQGQPPPQLRTSIYQYTQEFYKRKNSFNLNKFLLLLCKYITLLQSCDSTACLFWTGSHCLKLTSSSGSPHLSLGCLDFRLRHPTQPLVSQQFAWCCFCCPLLLRQGLRMLLMLALPPECWGSKCVPPCPASVETANATLLTYM